MGKINLRRGLIRLYLVLWAIWVPMSLWYAHEYYLVTFVVNWSKIALEEERAGAHEVAESSWRVANQYRKEWEESWFLVFGIVGLGLPALLYGLLYGSIMTLRGVLRWIVRG